MGKRGPRPKPTALKIVQGTYRPDRAPVNEPKPAPKVPSAPRWLGPDARAEWRRVVKQLAAIEMLTELDRTALALYCQALQEYLDAQRALDAENDYIVQARDRAAAKRADERLLRKAAGEAIEEEELEESFPHDGQTTISSKGTRIVHPLVLVRNEAWKRVLKAATEFGMTPSARTRIDLPLGAGKGDGPADPWSELARRRRA